MAVDAGQDEDEDIFIGRISRSATKICFCRLICIREGDINREGNAICNKTR